MTTLLIKGHLVTRGPLSIKLPEAEGHGANRWGNFPVETRGVDAAGVKLQSGYLPATTVRGFLRRAAVLTRMQAAASAGKHYRLQAVYSELIGQDAASESKEKADLLELRKTRDDNPILDLFGAGLSLSSRLLVSRFCPEQLVMPEVVTGVRKDLDETEDVMNMLTAEDQDAFFGRAEANTRRAAATAVVKQLQAKIRKAEKAKEPTDELKLALEEAQATQEKFVAEMGAMANSSKTLTSYWALPSGIVLTGRMVVERARDRDLPILEHALNALSLFPILGAQRARGCGEVAGEFEVYADGVLLEKIEIGDWQPARITKIS